MVHVVVIISDGGERMKKVKYLITSMMAFLLSFPVMAKDGCGSGSSGVCSPNVKCLPDKLPNTVHTIVLVLQIVVPILLVIFGMIDLIKAVVAGKEDEIKKAQGVFIRRLITGVLVFFVIAIVKLVVGLAGGSDFDKSMMNCVDAFLNGVD